MNQTSCLVNLNGREYMEEFDLFPFDVRKRLQNSGFNLCSYCVAKFAYELGDFHTAIEYMEGILLGKNMNGFIEAALRRSRDKYFDLYGKYTPKYFDDREYNIKRDWYTQKIERYDDSYLIPLLPDKNKLYF